MTNFKGAKSILKIRRQTSQNFFHLAQFVNAPYCKRSILYNVAFTLFDQILDNIRLKKNSETKIEWFYFNVPVDSPTHDNKYIYKIFSFEFKAIEASSFTLLLE